MTIKLLEVKSAYTAAELSWNTLAKAKNYHKLATREEYVAARKKVSLTIDHQQWVLNDLAKAALQKLVDTLHKDPSIKTLVSRATIDAPVFKELERELHNRKKSPKNKRKFSDVLEHIQRAIDNQIDSFEFFFPVNGLVLENIQTIGYGSVEIFLCSKDICNSLFSKYVGKSSTDKSEILELRRESFEQAFLDRFLIKSIAYGDSITAEKRAYRQARELINYLRFSICILCHERITKQMIRVNLSVEAYSNSHIFLSKRQSSDTISKHGGGGRKPLQPFTIDPSMLKKLNHNGFFRDFISITQSPSLTEIESLIITAIYWIGEAQNEFDLDVSFIKYWTALESIFTGNESPTKAVTEGISRLNAYSHYEFVKLAEIESVKREVSKLYQKRADIIHRGMRHIEEEDKGVSASEVSILCKYAVWSILSLFDLRDLNYTERSQMNSRIKGLHPPSVSEDLKMV